MGQLLATQPPFIRLRRRPRRDGIGGIDFGRTTSSIRSANPTSAITGPGTVKSRHEHIDDKAGYSAPVGGLLTQSQS
jgi:hypothetical protein